MSMTDSAIMLRRNFKHTLRNPVTLFNAIFMPLIMMFFFAPFAAGLQLYYVASNCLTILQQRWLYSRHPQLKAPAA